MVFKTEPDLKPGFLSYFHADLIQSLMQGLGKRGSKKEAQPLETSVKQRHVQRVFPPLNLAKVKKGLDEHDSSRRESSGRGKRANTLACTAVQQRKTEAQVENMTLRTPRKIDIVFDSDKQEGGRTRKKKHGSSKERQEGQHEVEVPEEQIEAFPTLQAFDNAVAIAHKNRVHRNTLIDEVEKLVTVSVPEADVSPVLATTFKLADVFPVETITKPDNSQDVKTNGTDKLKEVQGETERPSFSKVAPKFHASECTPRSHEPQQQVQPMSTPRKSQKLKLAEVSQAVKKVSQKSPRPDTKAITKPVPKQPKVKPLRLSETIKSSVPIGFGGDPVDALQTSRPSRVVFTESIPRFALTERSSYNPDSHFVMQPAPQNPCKDWENFKTPDVVLKQYGAHLSDFEKREILKFPEVYFIGYPDKRIQATEEQGRCNHGFDNDKGDYNALVHDHIAYRYEILGKLGKGSFGQVLKCADHKHKVLRAVKIIRSKKQFTQQAFIEINLLEFLRDKAAEEGTDYNIVTIYESFDFRGHLCLSFAVHDISLFDMLKKNNFEGFNLSLVKCFAKQLLVALQFLHRTRVIHGDLKPENILLQHASSPRIKLIDFGSSCFEHERIYTYIQSRFYRAPEVILGLPYDMMIDVWSFACILVELFTGYPLFPGEDEVEQLAYMMEILGTPPLSLISQAKRKKMFFDSANKPRIVPNSSGTRHIPATKDLKTAVGCSDRSFVDFLSCCLRWEKDQRLTPQQLLQHHWITQVQPLNEVVRYVRQSSGKRRSTKAGKNKLMKQAKLSYSTRA